MYRVKVEITITMVIDDWKIRDDRSGDRIFGQEISLDRRRVFEIKNDYRV